MARRDFTINAMARRLADGELVDPLGAEADLEARVLRTVSPQSFREDPLRLIRALRFVSQLGFEPDETLLEQMREEAAGVKLVSGERIGGGLAADGMGELSKLLMGREPARALTIARDTGVLAELIPEFAAVRAKLSDHIFAVVQASADAGDVLAVRLAALFHDVGKPIDREPLGHARVGAEIAERTLERLRYPTRLVRRVVAIVREHPFLAETRTTRAARAAAVSRRARRRSRRGHHRDALRRSSREEPRHVGARGDRGRPQARKRESASHRRSRRHRRRPSRTWLHRRAGARQLRSRHSSTRFSTSRSSTRATSSSRARRSSC